MGASCCRERCSWLHCFTRRPSDSESPEDQQFLPTVVEEVSEDKNGSGRRSREDTRIEMDVLQTVAEEVSEDKNGSVTIGNIAMYSPKDLLKKGHEVYQGILFGAIADEPVAIKILRPLEEGDKTLIEIESMIKVEDHTNTVSYRLSGTIEEGLKKGNVFIIMNLCKKKNLEDLITSDSAELENKTVLLHISHGLRFIHDHDILHRDLHPGNILLSLDGFHIKIADFGLSKQLDKEKSMFSRTTFGQEGWCSPETYNKHKYYKESDIYSAGLLFFYVLAGGKHIFGDNAVDRINAIKESSPPVFDKPFFTCPGYAKNLIGKMLAFEPEARPSAEDVLRHPFFWDDEKKREFLISCCQMVGTGKARYHSERKTVNWLDFIKRKGDQYSSKMSEIASEQKYDSLSVLDYLRCVRKTSETLSPSETDLYRTLSSTAFADLFCAVYEFIRAVGQKEPFKEIVEEYITTADNHPMYGSRQ